ncbi:MAG: phosphate signaling complex protein PhoU [Bacillota bacterium]|nr:phosphate signaling complex protein PhoU [Bacillota bacterium]MDW7729415.1 phosphate signaling complex protein PhoU [Bacillota bacterium]
MDNLERERKVVFEEKISLLHERLQQMGNLVEESIALSIEALKSQDLELARKVIDGDDVIDDLEHVIEDKIIEFIATQQPMAKDLRRVATLFKMINDLERMADYATSIARITLRIADQPLIKPLVDIPRMAILSQKMVKQALDAYVREDVELAIAVGKDDDEVDKLFGQIFRELLTIMMENPKTITQATHLLFVGRWLERISDHATNIAEEVIFLVTGEKRNLNE